MKQLYFLKDLQSKYTITLSATFLARNSDEAIKRLHDKIKIGIPKLLEQVMKLATDIFKPGELELLLKEIETLKKTYLEKLDITSVCQQQLSFIDKAIDKTVSNQQLNIFEKVVSDQIKNTPYHKRREYDCFDDWLINLQIVIHKLNSNLTTQDLQLIFMRLQKNYLDMVEENLNLYDCIKEKEQRAKALPAEINRIDFALCNKNYQSLVNEIGKNLLEMRLIVTLQKEKVEGAEYFYNILQEVGSVLTSDLFKQAMTYFELKQKNYYNEQNSALYFNRPSNILTHTIDLSTNLTLNK